MVYAASQSVKPLTNKSLFGFSQLALFLILLSSPFIAIAGTIQLPQTGQKTCYDINGVVISCPGTGQDGEIQAGVPWPNLRFIDHGNDTVTDNLTGLMWTPFLSLQFPSLAKRGRGDLYVSLSFPLVGNPDFLSPQSRGD